MWTFPSHCFASNNLDNYQRRPEKWSSPGMRQVHYQPENSTSPSHITQKDLDSQTGSAPKTADLITTAGKINPAKFAQEAWNELNETGNFLFLSDFHLCTGEHIKPEDDLDDQVSKENLEVEANFHSAREQLSDLVKRTDKEGEPILNGVVLMGDFMDARSDAYDNKGAFKEYILGILDQVKDAAGETPIYLSLGNHDLLRATELNLNTYEKPIPLTRSRLLVPIKKKGGSVSRLSI